MLHFEGEADLAFARLCRCLLRGQSVPHQIIRANPVVLDQIALPYAYYNDEDILHRTLYIEASRGCSFRCEFSLSSSDHSVRAMATDRLLRVLQYLWQRGSRCFKFVDRTSNLNLRTACLLLDFFLQKKPPYFVHFEVIPDHFPERLKQRIGQFPPASLDWKTASIHWIKQSQIISTIRSISSG